MGWSRWPWRGPRHHRAGDEPPESDRPLAALSDYELRNLVPHLVAAGHDDVGDRLLAWVEGTVNALWAETERRGDTEAFLDAVAVVRARAIDRMADSGGAEAQVSGVDQAVRYALYGGSVRALSGVVPAWLVARAVECGVISPAQGLALARQIASHAQRAETLARLHRFVEEPVQGDVAAEAMAAARTATATGQVDQHVRSPLLTLPSVLPDENLDELFALGNRLDRIGPRFGFLASVIQRRPDLASTAVDEATRVATPLARAEALTRLLPALPEALLPSAAAAALRAGLEFPRKVDGSYSISGDEMGGLAALADMVPYLDPTQLGKLRGVVDEVPIDRDKSRLLGALARRFTGADRESLVAAAVTLAGGGAFVLERARLLAPVSSLIPGRQARRAIRSGRHWAGGEWTADKLVDMAPHVEGRLWATYLQVARRIRAPGHRARALLAALPRVEAAARRELGAEVWTLVGVDGLPWSSGAGDDQGGTSEYVAQFLDPAAVAAGWARSRRIEDFDARARTIAELGLGLPQAAVSDAVAQALLIEDPGSRAYRIRDLAPRISPDDVPQVARAMRELEPSWRVVALAPCALAAAPADRPKIVADLLRAAQKSTDRQSASEAVAAIVPACSSIEIEKIIRLVTSGELKVAPEPVLAALAPRLTRDQLTKLLRGPHWPSVVDAVPADLIDTVVDRILAEIDDRAVDDALTRVASRLAAGQVRGILAAAEECLFAETRACRSCRLAPYSGPDEIEAAMLLAIRRVDDLMHADARGEMLRSMGEALASRDNPPPLVVVQALTERSLAVPEPGYRENAFAGVARCLPAELLEPAVQRLRDLGGGRPESLLSVLPALALEQRTRVIAEIIDANVANPRSGSIYRLGPVLAAAPHSEQLRLLLSIGERGLLNELPADSLAGLDADVAVSVLSGEVAKPSTFAGRAGSWEPLARAAARATPAELTTVLRLWLGTERDRPAWLAEIAALGPVLLAAGGPRTIQRIADSITDVGRYWP
ncbi:MAG TPA: hypothetical protein VFX33_15100 [Actinomycetales bacterium]|nr:hypothetical protein [Actinomycetales bacterium]